MPSKHSQDDERFIRKCIELSEKAIAAGDGPFGSIVVKDGAIISEGVNDAQSRTSDHAEILALNKAHQKLQKQDLTSHTLYTNCEPCPMCSFMIREYKISKVVFALPSPFMGGYSKWKILEDPELIHFPPFFKSHPEVIGGVLEADAKAVFDKTPLWMFGTNAREELKSRITKNS